MILDADQARILNLRYSVISKELLKNFLRFRVPIILKVAKKFLFVKHFFCRISFCLTFFGCNFFVEILYVLQCSRKIQFTEKILFIFIFFKISSFAGFSEKRGEILEYLFVNQTSSDS